MDIKKVQETNFNLASKKINPPKAEEAKQSDAAKAEKREEVPADRVLSYLENTSKFTINNQKTKDTDVTITLTTFVYTLETIPWWK